MADQINFFDIDAGAIYDLIIASLEQEVKEPLYPGDERRVFGEAVALLMVMLLNNANDNARQTLLRYARDETLDALGERVNTPRLKAKPAETILRFFVQQPLPQNVIIPAGTKVTPDDVLYFATTETAIILAGNTYADAAAQSTEGGSIYNDYPPGSLNNLVDLVDYVSGVQNIDTSHGADDGEPYTDEGNNKYRERIRIAPASFSTAGPDEAYRYFALSSDPNIRSIEILSDKAAGTVSIVVLMNNGEGPDADTTEKILAAVTDSKTRPLTDYVSVESPTFRNYDINIKYYVTATSESAAVNTIEGLGGSIDRYMTWQNEISRDINPDKLRALILAPNWESDVTLTGALRVDVSAPAFQQLGRRDVARFSGNITVTHEVVEE